MTPSPSSSSNLQTPVQKTRPHYLSYSQMDVKLPSPSKPLSKIILQPSRFSQWDDVHVSKDNSLMEDPISFKDMPTYIIPNGLN